MLGCPSQVRNINISFTGGCRFLDKRSSTSALLVAADFWINVPTKGSGFFFRKGKLY